MINIAIVEDNENDYNDLDNCLKQYQKENNLEFSIVRFNYGYFIRYNKWIRSL